MADDTTIIAIAIQQQIDSYLGNYRFIHCKPKDVSYGLGLDIHDIVKNALEQYKLTKKIPSKPILNIPLTYPVNPNFLRVRYSDGTIDYFTTHASVRLHLKTPGILIHPHEWETYDIKDDLRVANQRGLVNGRCELCKSLFLKHNIACLWNDKLDAQPQTVQRTDVKQVLLKSLKITQTPSQTPSKKSQSKVSTNNNSSPLDYNVDDITKTDGWPGFYWLERLENNPIESNDPLDRARQWKLNAQKSLNLNDEQFIQYIENLKAKSKLAVI